MMGNAHPLMNKFRQCWRALRTLTGDNAYELYLQHHSHTGAARKPLGRKAYFRNAQQGRWDKINRCC